ncbi:ParA family protein [Photobacterium kishitanii]|uniref:ParA family protein n=1 Tax=Photobacterium kishitanii TaxID=318456 RepID=A0A0B7JJ37_9GAMM|nr:ParA family protein [Photobacterium kishitanii]OBU23873.1 cobalamin biosynthesis protein CobQ [Photobacterium kishitanii]PSU86531.1 ParA family protein [Photobacterium kishitanii]PSU92866.1 ParA family protein [Photobacterium kishitanii]PSU93081.1 ParA family protein [Photobacterium kishitanii]PSV13148.1 ParA family protein [Photobacterium kishitanii]
MRRIIFNQKGGVGKSSITVNLAAISAAKGYKTLVIDLDIQGNSSAYLGIDINQPNDKTIAELLNQTASWFAMSTPISAYPQATAYDNLFIIPSSPKLDKLEVELERRYKIYKLREVLDVLAADFDRIYIDTPPNLNFYTKSGLIAAHKLLIPFDCDSFSQQALIKVMDNLAELRDDHNRDLELEGIVVNMFNTQAKFPRQIIEEIKTLGFPILEPYLPQSIKMKESHYQQCPMLYFDPKHKLTKQFIELYDGIETAVTLENKA